MIEELEQDLSHDVALDELVGILLRFCRRHAASLRAAYDKAEAVNGLASGRRKAYEWFKDLDDDMVEGPERSAFIELLRSVFLQLQAHGGDDEAAVVAARSAAEGLGEAFGARLRLAIRDQGVLDLKPGDPFPVANAPWKELFPKSLGTNPDRLGPRIDDLRNVRLMPPLTKGHSVTLSYENDAVVDGIRKDAVVAVVIPSDVIGDLTWDTDDDGAGKTFFSVRPKDSCKQLDAIITELNTATKANPQICVLPELCIDESCLDGIRKWYEESKEPIDLMVCGSLHRETVDGRRNVAVTLLPGTSIEHNKFNAFSINLPTEDGDPHREDIKTTPALIRIEMGGLWSFTTLICKDLLDPEVSLIIEETRSRLVLVPCCSPKTTDFETLAASMANRAQAVVVIANLANCGKDEPASVIISKPMKKYGTTVVRRASIATPYLHLDTIGETS